MFGSDVFVMAAVGFLPRLDQRAAYPVGEIVAGQKALRVVSPKISLPERSRKRLEITATFINVGDALERLNGKRQNGKGEQ